MKYKGKLQHIYSLQAISSSSFCNISTKYKNKQVLSFPDSAFHAPFLFQKAISHNMGTLPPKVVLNYNKKGNIVLFIKGGGVIGLRAGKL